MKFITISAAVFLLGLSPAWGHGDKPDHADQAVRKEQKARGREQWIEGTRIEPGTRVLLVDDVISTGGSTHKAYDRVTAAGGAISIDVGNPNAPTPFDPQVLTMLRTLGHTVNAPADIGSVQVVASDPRNGNLYGGADARREGTVIGVGKGKGRDRD